MTYKKIFTILTEKQEKNYFHAHGCGFYRAMHFSAKRSIAIACRLSVRPSVCDVGEL